MILQRFWAGRLFIFLIQAHHFSELFLNGVLSESFPICSQVVPTEFETRDIRVKTSQYSVTERVGCLNMKPTFVESSLSLFLSLSRSLSLSLSLFLSLSRSFSLSLSQSLSLSLSLSRSFSPFLSLSFSLHSSLSQHCSQLFLFTWSFVQLTSFLPFNHQFPFLCQQERALSHQTGSHGVPGMVFRSVITRNVMLYCPEYPHCAWYRR